MTTRSKFCEFDKEARKLIKKRDNNECVICHKKGALQIMHIFLSRAKGGKGCKENGCLGCIKCHSIIDNPIGDEQLRLSKQYLEYCKKYLIEKENIKDVKVLIEDLKFKKEKYYEEKITNALKEIDLQKNKVNRCKHCKMLIKSNSNNSSIPNYFCKYRKIRLSKNNKACKSFAKE